ncbi:MAG: hypothetical protein DRQ46_00500 [Gammaproteobacteria bacterium]|nr:MAG: hypothetical protein DRQ46_00500 [Gammaproteobacteria bacterium]
MAVKALYGFGGVAFISTVDQNIVANFPYANGVVSFTEEFHLAPVVALDGTVHFIRKGFRGNIEVLLGNYDDDQTEDLLILQSLINAGYMECYPRKATGDPGISFDEVSLAGSFAPKDIAMINAGQQVKLKFKARNLLSALPLITARTAEQNWIVDTATDDYLVPDASGDYLVFHD